MVQISPLQVKGLGAELAPPHVQSAWGFRGERVQGGKGSSCGVSNML